MICRRHAFLAACLVIATVVFRAPCAVPLPGPTVPAGFGTNIHFRGDPVDLDMIIDAGLKFIRMDFAWEGVERQKGVYDFEKSGYDALTSGCMKRGIRLLYILDYSNKLYESDRSVRTEEGRRAFAAFGEAAARRYAGKGILWEIWNESNIKQFWRPEPNVDDYCKLVAATAPRVRAADPSGLVVAPATSQIPHRWMEDCFKRGMLEHIDVVSVHPYRSDPPEAVIPDYARLRKLIKQYAPEGKQIPVISGEWGYSLVNWDKKRLSQETQAQYLARQFLIHLYQDIPVSIWYDWKDDGTDPDEREHNFGTVGHDLKPKSAYRAATVLAKTLDGYAFAGRINLGSDDDFILKLTKGRDEALALWTVKQPHEVRLEIGAGKGTLVDMLGERRSISWPAEGLQIEVGQSPHYLLVE